MALDWLQEIYETLSEKEQSKKGLGTWLNCLASVRP
jgi:hypothetical protein